MKPLKLLLCSVVLTAASLSQASTVGVFSTGNSSGSTSGVASWLQSTGSFTSVTGFDANTFSFAQLNAFDEVLFFTNGGGDAVNSGNALAQFAQTGKRLVVATFAWAQQSGNTVAGNFITGGYSPFTAFGSSAYSSVTMASNDGSALFSGVSTVSGVYHDRVQASAGATSRASWSDGSALVATKGNVVGVNLFPDDRFGQMHGDYKQLFVNSLTVTTPVPEPESYAMLLAGLGAIGAIVRRRKQQKTAV
ncbi:MAG: PEP-CTERM sorting domain-containing protein [Rhodoferax sp.]|nr:PEP-CTERM sorting domain-containing protein [Rhodoferax sp.]MDP3654913.1 PEP-CTERM sorting domain-containing protein [Rhodoferax sp.]